ncbi:MAG: phage tail tape measure protein [Carboxylicivirga sp.]|jgi:TP901 family phage tail tape measure protein|nr:phage tail tape measure protein [Carboxylicivirga sp.]
MAQNKTYNRRINLYINGKEVKNDVKNIKSEMNKLIAAQSKMTIGSKEYVKTGKDIQRLNTILKDHRKSIYNSGGAWSKLSSNAQRFVKLGIASVMAGAVAIMKRMATNSIKLEKALSSLSAITGATGDDLEYFRKKAIETSGDTLQSAEEVVRSYELVGSIRPELLKNKEALTEVTKQAIILSEATGGRLGVAEAAKATAVALNQFNMESVEATRVVNAFAAGSKEGAAAVPELSQAIDKFGAVAASGNLTLEQSIGLLETLAEKNIVGAEAGTKMRNILIKLQANQENYKNGVFDINLALDNLSKKQLGVTELTKEFGTENVVAAQILVNNTDKYHAYTKAVTDTNTALEQQAIQNDNVTANWQKFVNMIDSALTSPGFSGKLNDIIKGLTGAIYNLQRSMMSSSEIADDFINSVMGRINTADSAEEKVKRLTTLIKQQEETMALYKQQLDEMSWFSKQDLWWSPAKDANALYKAIASTEEKLEKLNIEKTKAQTARLKESFNFSGKSMEDLLVLEGQYLVAEDLLTKKQKLKLDAIREEIKLRNNSNNQKSAEEPKNNEELEKYLKEKERAEEGLADSIRKIRDKLHLDTLSAHEKEKQAIEYKYADLLDTAQKYAMDESELIKLKTQELQFVDERFAKERLQKQKEVQAQLESMYLSEFEKEKQEKIRHLQKMIAMAEENGLMTIEAYTLMQEELDLIRNSEEPRDIFGMTDEDWLKLIDNFDMAMMYIDQIGMAWGSIITIQNNKDKAELKQYEKNTQKKKDLLNKQLEAGSISQEQYNARVAKLDADLDKKKSEIAIRQAKREKQLGLFQVAVNTAMAVMKIWAEVPKADFGISTGILTALAIANGALQAAAISSAPVPEYAEGGYTHGDRIYRAGEAGTEWIANNQMVNNPDTGPVIAALEAVQRGKAPASMFGGVTPAFSEMMEVPRYAAGGYTQPSTNITTTNISQSDNSSIEQLLRLQTEELQNIAEFLSDPQSRQAIISNYDLGRNEIENAERNSLGRIG